MSVNFQITSNMSNRPGQQCGQEAGPPAQEQPDNHLQDQSRQQQGLQLCVPVSQSEKKEQYEATA